MRSTLDRLQGRRTSRVLVARNRLLKSTFRPRPRVAADTIVQSLSGDAVALPGLASKKACKCRPSRKRLKGFEPSTFCMASRARDSVQCGISLQNTPLLPRERVPPCPAFTAKSRERTETGLALIPSAAGARTSAGAQGRLFR